jgi:hypothetical protein
MEGREVGSRGLRKRNGANVLAGESAQIRTYPIKSRRPYVSGGDKMAFAVKAAPKNRTNTAYAFMVGITVQSATKSELGTIVDDSFEGIKGRGVGKELFARTSSR